MPGIVRTAMSNKMNEAIMLPRLYIRSDDLLYVSISQLYTLILIGLAPVEFNNIICGEFLLLASVLADLTCRFSLSDSRHFIISPLSYTSSYFDTPIQTSFGAC